MSLFSGARWSSLLLIAISSNDNESFSSPRVHQCFLDCTKKSSWNRMAKTYYAASCASLLYGCQHSLYHRNRMAPSLPTYLFLTRPCFQSPLKTITAKVLALVLAIIFISNVVSSHFSCVPFAQSYFFPSPCFPFPSPWYCGHPSSSTNANQDVSPPLTVSRKARH